MLLERILTGLAASAVAFIFFLAVRKLFAWLDSITVAKQQSRDSQERH